jgi:hypothetical protein
MNLAPVLRNNTHTIQTREEWFCYLHFSAGYNVIIGHRRALRVCLGVKSLYQSAMVNRRPPKLFRRSLTALEEIY